MQYANVFQVAKTDREVFLTFHCGFGLKEGGSINIVDSYPPIVLDIGSAEQLLEILKQQLSPVTPAEPEVEILVSEEEVNVVSIGQKTGQTASVIHNHFSASPGDTPAQKKKGKKG